MNRRHFSKTAAVSAASAFAGLQSTRAANDPTHTVGIIGHTGRGNYGHGLDTVWLKIPGAKIVGVADADAGGLEKELGRLNIESQANVGFSDYREMLKTTQPEFVSVCPRHVDQHRDMCIAAIEAGVRGIYIEKPFLRTPAECDEVLSAAEKAGTKIAVAHRNRYHPVLQVIGKAIAEGKIGKFLEIRARGKGDRRGGPEDLWVLGTHVLNLVEYFGGKALSCSAVILKDGKPVTKSDVNPKSNEGLGPLAGNELHARFLMEKGIVTTFDSIANDDTNNHGFGLVLVGSRGQFNIQCDRTPLAHYLPGNPLEPSTSSKAWVPVTTAGIGEKESAPELVTEVQNHVAAIQDLIASVDDKDRTPACDAHEAARTVEMVCAVFESHRLTGKAVKLPLEQREKNALNLL